MTRAPLVFGLPGNEAVAAALATALNGELGDLTLAGFPDRESYLRVDTDPRKRDVVVLATLHHPNSKALPLLFVADALRDLGATRVGVVAPYLAYMRQDARFHPGEAITSRSFAAFLSRSFEWLVTVDPHLHRFRALSEIYTIPAYTVHVADAMGAWIAANVDEPFVIGPDAESRQWVDAIAAAAHAPSTILTKVRRGDRDVVESIPDLHGRPNCTPVLVDDIISTGHTMIEAMRHLHETGARRPYCVAVHAVFALGAHAALMAESPTRIVTTNTIPHETNAIDAIPSIAAAVAALAAGHANAGRHLI